jgi:hypothetical protein
VSDRGRPSGWKWRLGGWKVGLLLVCAGLLLAGIQDRTDGEPMPPVGPDSSGTNSAATALR